MTGEPRLGRYKVGLSHPPPVSGLSALPGIAAVQAIEPKRFRVTMRPGEDPAALSRRLVEQGWGLTEFTPEGTDLERVFFDILGGEKAA